MSQSFIDFIRACGLEPPEHLITGQKKRFPGAGKKPTNRAAVYYLFPDGKGGWIADYSSGLYAVWQEQNDYSPDEKAAFRRKCEELKRQAEKEQQERYDKAAKLAQAIWESCTPAPADHPYLVAKKIGVHRARVDKKGNLVLPLYNRQGVVRSIQRIAPNGKKLYLAGGQKRGGFWWIGEATDTIYVCEGFATAASKHEHTKCRAVVAYDAPNMVEVAKSVRWKYPNAKIIIAGDNDVSGTGQDVAKKAAAAINAEIWLPPNPGEDWNDYYNNNTEQVQIMSMDFREESTITRAVKDIIAKLPKDASEILATNAIFDELVTGQNVTEQVVRVVVESVCSQIVTIHARKTSIVKEVKARLTKAKRTERIVGGINKEGFPDKAYSKEGEARLLPTANNLRYLAEQYKVKIFYDEAVKQQEILMDGELSIEHDLRHEAQLQKLENLAILNEIHPSIMSKLPILMEENTINPVKDWILSKEWDGVSRVAKFCRSIITADADAELSEHILFKWLIQAVAALDRSRLAPPSALPKYELVLIFQGAQGAEKTTWFSKLLPEEVNGQKFSRRYIGTSIRVHVGNKDSEREATSRWIVELGEFDSTMSRNEWGTIKGFLSRESDRIRLPYAKSHCDFIRSVVFGASVNDAAFLDDKTGSRRFGVIRVVGINNQHGVDMQQLWAEIWHEYYAKGATWWLNKETEQLMQESNGQHEMLSVIEDALTTRFDWDCNPTLWTRPMTMLQIAETCKPNPTKKDLNEVKPALVRLGVKVKMGTSGALKNRPVAYMPPVKGST